MNYKIVKKGDGLEVEISDIQGKEGQLLEAFRECSEGRCGCPTKEYTKLQDLRVEKDTGMLRLRLTARKGQQFDQAEIQRCLDYTDERIERSG